VAKSRRVTETCRVVKTGVFLEIFRLGVPETLQLVTVADLVPETLHFGLSRAETKAK
jgi:hypothetical protein